LKIDKNHPLQYDVVRHLCSWIWFPSIAHPHPRKYLKELYMERFGFARASSIAEAILLLNEPGLRSRPLAGGTDLMLITRITASYCDRVVDITQIPALRQIQRSGDLITIGAAATFSEVIESRLVAETAPVLTQACRQVGATQIRNMGTLGGNVANAATCADSLPALVCLDSMARVATAQGESYWLVSDLVIGPNRTQIPAGGLLVSLRYQVPLPGSRSVFLKLGRRNAMAISRLTIAALGRLDADGRIAEARFVPGSATPRICHFKSVEESLIGQMPGPALYQAAAQCAVDEMAQLAGRRWSSEFKEPTLIAMTIRALTQIFEPEASAKRRQL
jgi:CO/xanthine dehydrogenase FAD-binding subunit